MTQSQAETAPAAGGAKNDSSTHEHIVQIHVNNRAVDVLGPKSSGIAIKEAAIRAGLPIKEDFVVIEDRPNGDDETIGDSDPVTVNPQSRFTVVAPDDNS